MKALIGGSLAGSKRVTGLIICMAVIIGLASTGSVSAVPTTTFTLDGSEAWTGTPGSMSLTLTTPISGNITFTGEIREPTYGDPEMITASSSGNLFDIDYPIGNFLTAEMFFDFDVISAKFIYGGNYGWIYVEARDIYGVKVASLSKRLTGDDDPAGPETLSGLGIRSLYWIDDYPSPLPQGFAALDNIEFTVTNIPAPGALMLAGIGVGCVGGWRKRKIA